MISRTKREIRKVCSDIRDAISVTAIKAYVTEDTLQYKILFLIGAVI